MNESDTLTASLHYHLQHNHYPPVPVSMIPVCIAAIDALHEDDPDREIALPEGVFWRNREAAPAWAIAEAHHLGCYIDDDEEIS